uniref:Defensin-like protein 1 n=1 Tax=Panax ginseng TaxID=4054 RepID=A0A6M9YZD2_PANGI|nr:defensin-like protein 1 [Panax ginseng]
MAIKFSPTTFITVSLIFFLLANTEGIIGVEGKLCEKASLTWSGKCGNTQNCDKQCQNWESAKHGACHKRPTWKCFCYSDC